MTTVEITPWRLRWNGGRLADITHAEYGDDRSLSCVQVGAYDWQRGKLVREPDEGALLLRLAEWIASDERDEVAANVLPYLR
jgi:hypothetical protein